MSQQNKTTLQAAINSQLADNTSGDISAADVRNNLINMTDSLLFNSGSQGITGSLNISQNLTVSGNIVGNISGSVSIGGVLSTTPTGVQITGSLIVSGSNTLINVGPMTTGDVGNVAGFDALAQGSSTQALGTGSHAEGYQSIASGSFSHAEGGGGINPGGVAEGVGSHAEGNFTLALGDFSHAEGANTQARGYGAHTEGNATRATGSFGHAEGQQTLAGSSAHAEGYFTTASGVYSHAEGFQTKAIGLASHAEGRDTIVSAFAVYSHAEGERTLAANQYVHAEGFNTTASGNNSHAEGHSAHSSGTYSHAEGYLTITLGNYSHTEGYQTTASGLISHAEGKGTLTLGEAAHSEGSGSVAIGVASHAEGLGTIAAADYQHVSGKYNISSSNTNNLFIIGNGEDDSTRNNILLVNTSSLVLSGSILISGSIIPNVPVGSTTSSFNLGSPTAAWKDIYVSEGTINFLNSAGAIQGTIGAGAAGTVITGSLAVVSYGNEELNLETQGFNGVFSKLFKQKQTAAGIKLAADFSSGLDLNYGLYTYFTHPVLPWDKKITSYFIYNDLSSSATPEFLFLPPLANAPYTPGEVITVYNVSPSASANIKNSGSLKVSCFGQGVLAVNTGAKTVTSVLNSQCPILSGSWGNYKSINYSFGFSSSLEVPPGKKATFEVFDWGNFTVFTSASYPFYNGDFSGDGYSDVSYGAVYKLISVSDI